MTFYHPTKGAAQEVADRIELDHADVDYCKVELEPNNGWVVVAVPKVRDIFDLADRCEVRHPNGKRLSARPTSYKRIAQPSAPKAVREPGEPGQAPTKGATGRVWEIADKVTAEKGGTIDRGAIIAACEAAGINPATAATQFSRWKRTRLA